MRTFQTYFHMIPLQLSPSYSDRRGAYSGSMYYKSESPNNSQFPSRTVKLWVIEN